MGRRTRFASLEIGAEGAKQVGVVTPVIAVPILQLFLGRVKINRFQRKRSATYLERLFEGTRAGESKQMRANRLKFSRSILDFALDDAKRLQQVVGQADKRKLDEYLTSVRELEQRVQRRSRMNQPLQKNAKPDGIPETTGITCGYLLIFSLCRFRLMPHEFQHWSLQMKEVIEATTSSEYLKDITHFHIIETILKSRKKSKN